MNKKIKQLKDFYVTSDTWFGRSQILQIANRNFKNVEQMNRDMVKEWNKVVNKDAIVFHLGNFAWDPDTAEKVLKKLNGSNNSTYNSNNPTYNSTNPTYNSNSHTYNSNSPTYNTQ